MKGRRADPAGGRWHMDEVFVSTGGRGINLWRAVDAEGEVLDILVQQKRDKRAALKLSIDRGAVQRLVVRQRDNTFRRPLSIHHPQILGAPPKPAQETFGIEAAHLRHSRSLREPRIQVPSA